MLQKSFGMSVGDVEVVVNQVGAAARRLWAEGRRASGSKRMESGGVSDDTRSAPGGLEQGSDVVGAPVVSICAAVRSLRLGCDSLPVESTSVGYADQSI